MKSDFVKEGRNQTMQKVIECNKKSIETRQSEESQRNGKKTSARIFNRLRNIIRVNVCAFILSVCSLSFMASIFALDALHIAL